MKKFIINIVLFGSFLFIINIFLFSFTYNVYLKPYEKINLQYEDYLLSDSHGLALENFTEEYGIYNFSAGSDSYTDMLRKLKYLISKTRVKRIIIAVDDHTLSPYREKKNNLDRSVYFTTRKDFPDTFSFLKVCIKRYIALLNPKSRDVVRSFIRSKLSRKSKSVDWDKITENNKIKKSIKRFNDQFLYKRKSGLLTTSFNDIISLCKNNNIELIGIKYPLSRSFINILGDKNYHADSILCQQGLKVYDYKHLYSDKDYYFSNQDHLNKNGGREFVKVLSTNLCIKGTNTQHGYLPDYYSSDPHNKR